jgi:hypothetical protein
MFTTISYRLADAVLLFFSDRMCSFRDVLLKYTSLKAADFCASFVVIANQFIALCPTQVLVKLV